MTFTFVQGNLPSGTGTDLSWSFILDSRFAYGNKIKMISDKIIR